MRVLATLSLAQHPSFIPCECPQCKLGKLEVRPSDSEHQDTEIPRHSKLLGTDVGSTAIAAASKGLPTTNLRPLEERWRDLLRLKLSASHMESLHKQPHILHPPIPFLLSIGEMQKLARHPWPSPRTHLGLIPPAVDIKLHTSAIRHFSPDVSDANIRTFIGRHSTSAAQPMTQCYLSGAPTHGITDTHDTARNPYLALSMDRPSISNVRYRCRALRRPAAGSARQPRHAHRTESSPVLHSLCSRGRCRRSLPDHRVWPLLRRHASVRRNVTPTPYSSSAGTSIGSPVVLGSGRCSCPRHGWPPTERHSGTPSHRCEGCACQHRPASASSPDPCASRRCAPERTASRDCQFDSRYSDADELARELPVSPCRLERSTFETVTSCLDCKLMPHRRMCLRYSCTPAPQIQRHQQEVGSSRT